MLRRTEDVSGKVDMNYFGCVGLQEFSNKRDERVKIRVPESKLPEVLNIEREPLVRSGPPLEGFTSLTTVLDRDANLRMKLAEFSLKSCCHRLVNHERFAIESPVKMDRVRKVCFAEIAPVGKVGNHLHPPGHRSLDSRLYMNERGFIQPELCVSKAGIPGAFKRFV